MDNQKILSEEKFQGQRKMLVRIAIIVLAVGLAIGIGTIVMGKVNNSSPKVSATKIAELKSQLEQKKSQLIAKGITYDTFAKYDDGEKYELKIITNVLDPSFDYCSFAEYKNSSVTGEYCKAIDKTIDTSATFNSESSMMIGIFIIIATIMISGSIFFFANGRSIAAFQVQQHMPIYQEGMEKMAPTVGKVGSEVVTTMAPAYKEVAKEVSQGIKEGLSDKEEKKK